MMSALPKICDREQLPGLFNAMGLLDKGVEIGVQWGGFSSVLRTHWQGELLYLVDRWCYVPGYQDTANVAQEEQERLYQGVLKMFEGNRGVEIIRAESLVAAQRFANESLDWIYLDADHSRAAVEKDLTAWWPKLKRGGIFAGHDYVDGLFFESEFGVQSAVDEFALKHQLEIFTTGDAHFPSWYCQKPFRGEPLREEEDRSETPVEVAW